MIYTHETELSLKQLRSHVEFLKQRFKKEDEYDGRLIIRSDIKENAYDTKRLCEYFNAEAQDLFDSRAAVLGYLQQGKIPSPCNNSKDY